jgi:antitoxin ParD1/3/4
MVGGHFCLWLNLAVLDIIDILGEEEKKEEAPMNVSFTKKQEEYISAQLKTGDYQNASEVVRDALRLHEVYRHRVIDELRVEMAKGWEGPASPRKVHDIIRVKARARKS